MAGGKETPRQKLIGMMYLVLTALLALQVSSSIMLKFKFLDDSLMDVNRKTITNNVNVTKGIEAAVTKAGNRAADKKVVDDANQVRTKTAEIITYLEATRKKLVDASGGMENGQYKDPNAEDKVANIMIGPNKNGEAYKMKDKLNQYASFMKAYNPTVPKLAIDAKEDPVASKDVNSKGKDFAELNFEATPLTAALAVIAQKESEILKYEADALSTLASKVGADIIKFDKIFAMARAESKTVAAGTKYKADMFIAASSNAITPIMTYQGRPVKVENGLGKIEFTAQAGAYDKEGISKQSWTGQIRINNNGRDTTFTLKEEYFVAKPVIQVQSASVQALYLNCGNELNVQVPALGATYDPSFSATGAAVVKGSEKGVVTLVPSAKEVTLNVSSGGNKIGSEKFQVRLIPKPEITALTNGRPVNEKQGMAAPGPRSITMKAIPDESFKTFLPKDARYRVFKWEVFLVRGRKAIASETINGETANLTSFAAMAKEGDRISIEVKEVKRLNFRNATEDVNIGTKIINIPLN
ncbi:gliding motility protein GldM [Adhaeribacter sp. BT258]|uniref:Gliding motility protein GldM n=1 Tax=Adhaeribacter terrigena TaxID=2793070 RepID=A0ABS1C4E6_9BACT|nr:gliding motility protein GldM [Adhaeribacter terrigena]MBK0404277.1 gliding motility protein GldM [Adhaeribacter terrigena]